MALSKIGSIVSISQIDAIYPTEKDLIYDLMESGLLKKDRMCDKCGASMKLRSRGDGLEWRCRTSNKKDCSSKSVKAESWFRHSNLDFKTALRIFVGFSSKLSGIQLERELHLSHSTIVDWSSMIREICVGIADNYGMIGGDGKVVELDETAVHSRKYGRGIQKAPTVWILGGLERGTRNVFATIVPNRTAKTMVPIIRKNVHAGSILVTDKWGSYNKLSQYYSRHENLNHGTEFARTADDGLSVNTNSVEAAWARLKEPLKRGHGTTDDNLPVFIPFGDAYKNYESSRSRQAVGYHVDNVMKLRCHQCNQPHDCATGVCYGDICVKSLVNNHYVSKGCENLTISSSVYEPHLKMRTYCKEEEVLGVDTINCYCRDADFCNSSPSFALSSLLYFFALFLRL